jgi:3'(2'), 5'-bisphosphate nucleotidase
MYPRLGPTMEWDTGAAHAVIIESGSMLAGYIKGNIYTEHKYNKFELLNESFVVSGSVQKKS